VLQKYVLPGLTRHLVLQKQPYDYTDEAFSRLPGVSLQDQAGNLTATVPTLRKALEDITVASLVSQSIVRNQLFSIIRLLCSVLSSRTYKDHPMLNLMIRRALLLSAQAVRAGKGTLGLLISSEGLSNSFFPLGCNFQYLTHFDCLPIDVLANAWESLPEAGPLLISFCLRDPLDHLISRYARYRMNDRPDVQAHPLSPAEWIHCQAEAWRLAPAASALFPVCHGDFIRYHCRHGYVKAYGFRQILSSADLLRMIGLRGESAISFASLPRENQAAFAPKSKPRLKQIITDALRQEGCLEMILAQKMYD
jgi:hypothetical protein